MAHNLQELVGDGYGGAGEAFACGEGFVFGERTVPDSSFGGPSLSEKCGNGKLTGEGASGGKVGRMSAA